MDAEEAKGRVVEAVDRRRDVLLDASRQIHAHPELGFQERFAHDLLTGILDEEGLAPERAAFGVPTAFAARAGTSGPTVAVMCEYDALPGIGHACGHNIIATAGLGAGLAAASVADALGGRVLVLGTPAEEGGGGKVDLLQAGALDDVDAALMVHPAGADLTRMNAIAVQQLRASYRGRAAHAAAAPHRGRNALDAAVLGYVNVAALRQHIRPEERIHGVFTDGGDKPNIVPARAETEWYVRAATLERLEPLKARVLACLRAGAEAAGCEVELTWLNHPYADMRDNGPMVALYQANAARLGRAVTAPDDLSAVIGSTDMGNVSYVVPAIHPMIAVSPPSVSIHTPEFATCAGGPEGDRAVLDGAKALAMTIVDLWTAPGALDAARTAFAEATAGSAAPAG